MKIWEIHSNIDDYKVLITSKKEDINMFDLFNGEPVKNEWKNLQVEFGKSKRPKSDSPILTVGILVLNEKCINIFNKYFANFELLELDFKDNKKEYWIMNITNVVDCLDHEKSDLLRSSIDGRLVRCYKYAFIEEKVKSQHIFKIPEFPRAHIFVSDEFKQTVEEAGLTGFLFEEAWDSEK